MNNAVLHMTFKAALVDFVFFLISKTYVHEN